LGRSRGNNKPPNTRASLAAEQYCKKQNQTAPRKFLVIWGWLEMKDEKT
jgi:hypothetical protein